MVVGLPEDGDLSHIATLTEWEAEGHVKSIRAALRQFRADRRAIRQDRVATRSPYQGVAMSWSSGIGVRASSGG